MKLTLLSLVLVIGSIFAAAGEDSKDDAPWYRFSISGRGDIVASCELTPSELSTSLEQNQYVCLTSVHEMSAEGKWLVASAPYTNTQYIRADTVKWFSPLTARPKDFGSTDAALP